MKQAERRARTNKALLASAGEVFARLGYSRASLELIAEHAGISKGGIYAHFTSKLDLYLAALERLFDDAEHRIELVAAALRSAAAPHAAARHYRGSHDDSLHDAAMTDAWQVAAGEPRVHERLERHRQFRLARLGEACVDAGLPPAVALERARTTAALIDSRMLEARLGLRHEA